MLDRLAREDLAAYRVDDSRSCVSKRDERRVSVCLGLGYRLSHGV